MEIGWEVGFEADFEVVFEVEDGVRQRPLAADRQLDVKDVEEWYHQIECPHKQESGRTRACEARLYQREGEADEIGDVFG